MTPRRLEPNERAKPDLTAEDWEIATKWLPVAYQSVLAFVKKVTKRKVFYRGRIGTPEFQWYVSDGSAYGIDPVGLCQDLESRAIEALAVAIHKFDPEKGGEHLSALYLKKAIRRQLQDEFDRWVLTSSSLSTISYGSAADPILPDDATEPAYLAEFDQDEPAGLSSEDQDRLQSALGVLSAKEGWALRLLADGWSMSDIAKELNLNGTAVYRVVKTAQKKAQKAFEEA